MSILPLRKKPADTPPAIGQRPLTERMIIQDLAILVSRLAHQLPDDNQTRKAALDYLRRHSLQGSVIRAQDLDE